MGITRKFVILVTIFILTATPFMVKTYAKKPLAIFNGQEVSVIDNGFEFKIKANGNTVIEILKNSGITVNEQDIVFPTGTLKKNQKIMILRAVPLTIKTESGNKKIYTLKETVGEALKEAGVKTSSSNLNHKISEKVYPRMKIVVLKKPKSKPVLKIASIQAKKTKRVLARASKPKPKSKPVSKIKKTGETQIGSASWYNYIPGNYCASLRFPRGAKLLVTNTSNGRSVMVTVNDSGPFNGRVIDLERNAFSQIASPFAGTANVRVERIR